MKTYNKIITAVVAGIACSAASSQAALTSLSPSPAGTEVGLSGAGTGYALSSGATLLKSVSTDFSFGASNPSDTGTFVSSVYSNDGNNTLNGYTFVYSITVATGDVSTLDLNSGFGQPVGVANLTTAIGSNLATFENAENVTFFSAGNINFVWSPTIAPNGGPTETVTVVIDTNANTYGDATASLIDSGVETVADLVPVPEPTTVMAGALMLLPFGIGAVRSLRKERAA